MPEIKRAPQQQWQWLGATRTTIGCTQPRRNDIIFNEPAPSSNGDAAAVVRHREHTRFRQVNIRRFVLSDGINNCVYFVYSKSRHWFNGQQIYGWIFIIAGSVSMQNSHLSFCSKVWGKGWGFYSMLASRTVTAPASLRQNKSKPNYCSLLSNWALSLPTQNLHSCNLTKLNCGNFVCIFARSLSQPILLSLFFFLSPSPFFLFLHPSTAFINSFRSTIFAFILWISARFWAISRWIQWCIACFQPELPTIPYLSLASVEWKFPKFSLDGFLATPTTCVKSHRHQMHLPSWCKVELGIFACVTKTCVISSNWEILPAVKIQTQNNSNAYQLNELQSFMWTTFTQAHRRKFVSLAIFAVNIRIFIQIDGSFWSPTKLWTN